MSHLDEMTPEERARVIADIEGQRPVRMRRLADDRIVHVGPDRVAERLASKKYELVDGDS